ncbi:unnamed protein product [Linum tenue]|nr:unnamed protein product [Linum tenue]CAI0418171.1 unnamed protein product [Linum tenue]
MANAGVAIAKSIEESYRKPKKRDVED